MTEELIETLNWTAAGIRKFEPNLSSKAVDIYFVNSDEIKQLNRRFFGRDKTTDILSFTSDFLESNIIGELVINKDIVAKKENRYEGTTIRPLQVSKKPPKPTDPELKLVKLFIHGTLHLLGYNHLETKAHHAMLKKEKKVLDWLLGNL